MLTDLFGVFSILHHSLVIHFTAALGGWGEEAAVRRLQIYFNQSVPEESGGQSQSFHVTGKAYATRQGDMTWSYATYEK